MEPAIKRIVETYVRLKNRKAIEDLVLHRLRLANDLKGRKEGYDFSRPIAQIQEELAIILTALARLDPAHKAIATRSPRRSLAAPQAARARFEDASLSH